MSEGTTVEEFLGWWVADIKKFAEQMRGEGGSMDMAGLDVLEAVGRSGLEMAEEVHLQNWLDQSRVEPPDLWEACRPPPGATLKVTIGPYTNDHGCCCLPFKD